MSVKEYIESGILEQYVLGFITSLNVEEVEMMISIHPEIRREVDSISELIESYAFSNPIKPNPLVKPFLMATINFTERMQGGEQESFPPMLHQQSKVEDYSQWLERDDMVLEGNDDIFARIISYTPKATTVIVWLKDYAPQEVHDAEHERFLIVEGTCNIIVEDEINKLVAGDYFAIPLHKKHNIKVTSLTPCKVILQRVAA